MSEYTLREIQEFYLKMLIDFDELCHKHNLTYWLGSGTLLGAVRHKGFIPWDDDIDVEMPTEDYFKFCKIANRDTEFRKKYFLQDYKTDPKYFISFAKIRANNTTSMPLKYKELDINWGMCIDIFPIVGEYNNKFLKKMQWFLFKVNEVLLCVERNKIMCNKKSLRDKVLFLMPIKLRHFICDINNKFIFKSFYKSQRAIMLWDGYGPLWGKDTCRELVKLEFEGHLFDAPIGWDYILTHIYGDYMTPPPLDERGGHEQFLGDIIMDLERDYTEYKN